MNIEVAVNEPSKKLLEMCKEFRDKELTWGIKIWQEKYCSIIDLANEELPFDKAVSILQKEINRYVDVDCDNSGCGKKVNVLANLEWDNNDKPYITHIREDCGECKDKKYREEFLRNQEEERKEHQAKPILNYAHKIRGSQPYYAGTYEEYKERQEKSRKVRDANIKALSDSNSAELSNLCGNKEITTWLKNMKHHRREQKEEKKGRLANNKLKYEYNPARLLQKTIDKVGRRCEAELMRQGIFCETCRLFVRVNEYMLSLFKDGADGRSSYI